MDIVVMIATESPDCNPIGEVVASSNAPETVREWLDRFLMMDPERIPFEDQIPRFQIERALHNGGVIHAAAESHELVPVDVDRPLTAYALSRQSGAVVFLRVCTPTTARPNKPGWIADIIGSFDRATMRDVIRPPEWSESIAVVLGGGGAKGAAQAGALTSLLEFIDELRMSSPGQAGPAISYMVASSIGAANGFLVSCGRAQQLETLWSDMNIIRAWRLPAILKNMTRGCSPSIPIEVTSVCLQTGSAAFSAIEDGSIDAVATSMRFPGVRGAVRQGSLQFFDGGVTANLPTMRCIERGCDWIFILGMHSSLNQQQFHWPWSQARRALEIQGAELQQSQLRFLHLARDVTQLRELATTRHWNYSTHERLNALAALAPVGNVVVVPVQRWMTCGTFDFRGHRCRGDYRRAREGAKDWLASRFRVPQK